MFNNTLILYIDYLLFLKDKQININFLLMYDIFIKYYNKELSKDDLLDEHTKRNKLICEWYDIYKYKKYNLSYI